MENDYIFLFIVLALYYFFKNHNIKSEIYREDPSDFPELREIINFFHMVCLFSNI